MTGITDYLIPDGEDVNIQKATDHFLHEIGGTLKTLKKFLILQKNIKVHIMKRTVLLILISKRKEAAETVQKILTGWGCFIKTRLGIHDGVLDSCSESGLIFLELTGDSETHSEIARKLNLVKGVDAKLVFMEVE